METATALQRIQEKPGIIYPVKIESLVENVNEMFESVAKRAYQIFERNGRTPGHDLDDWFKAEIELLHPVHIEISDAGDELEVKAEVPGFSEKEINVSVEPRRLTITGKRECKSEEKKGKTVYGESCSNQILRVMDLPMAIDADKVSASLKNGILQLTMPKAARGKTIDIKPKAA